MGGEKFMVYGGRRWRELDLELGRVSGWGAVKFVSLRRGRLCLEPRTRVWRALRALASGERSAAHNGLRLVQIRSEAVKHDQRVQRAEGEARAPVQQCSLHTTGCAPVANFNCIVKTTKSIGVQCQQMVDMGVQATPSPSSTTALGETHQIDRNRTGRSELHTNNVHRHRNATKRIKSSSKENRNKIRELGNYANEGKKDKRKGEGRQLQANKDNIQRNKNNRKSETKVLLRRQNGVWEAKSLQQFPKKKDMLEQSEGKKKRTKEKLQKEESNVTAEQEKSGVNRTNKVNGKLSADSKSVTEKTGDTSEETDDTGTQSENSACKELFITEDVVEVLRRFLARDPLRTLGDVRRFDRDTAYRAELFYRLNPLVTLQRSARIAELLQQRQRDFAAALGLRTMPSEGEDDKPSPARQLRPRPVRSQDLTPSPRPARTPSAPSRPTLSPRPARTRSSRASILPRPARTRSPHPVPSPRPARTPSPHPVPSPHPARTRSPNPVPSPRPARTRSPHPVPSPRPARTRSPHPVPSPHLARTRSPHPTPSPCPARTISPQATTSAGPSRTHSSRPTRRHSPAPVRSPVSSHNPTSAESTRPQDARSARSPRPRLAHTSEPRQTRLQNGSGRKKLEKGSTLREYNEQEDNHIISWLQAEGRARLVNGNRIWWDLPPLHAANTGVNRTWQSLRNRYLRYILPSLGTFSLPPGELARLRASAATGTMRKLPTRPLTPKLRSASGVVNRNRKLTVTPPPRQLPASPSPPRQITPPGDFIRTPSYDELTKRYASRHRSSSDSDDIQPRLTSTNTSKSESSVLSGSEYCPSTSSFDQRRRSKRLQSMSPDTNNLQIPNTDKNHRQHQNTSIENNKNYRLNQANKAKRRNETSPDVFDHNTRDTQVTSTENSQITKRRSGRFETQSNKTLASKKSDEQNKKIVQNGVGNDTPLKKSNKQRHSNGAKAKNKLTDTFDRHQDASAQNTDTTDRQKAKLTDTFDRHQDASAQNTDTTDRQKAKRRRLYHPNAM